MHNDTTRLSDEQLDSNLDAAIKAQDDRHQRVLFAERSRRIRLNSAYNSLAQRTVPITPAQHFYLFNYLLESIDESAEEMWEDLHDYKNRVVLKKTRLIATERFLVRLMERVDPEYWAEEQTVGQWWTPEQYDFAYRSTYKSAEALERRIKKALLERKPSASRARALKKGCDWS